MNVPRSDEGSVSSFRLDGKNAVVVGASRGLGRATALALAKAGANVFCVARSELELSRLSMRVRLDGGYALPLIADVTQTRERARIFQEVPGVDVVINSAGMNIPEPLLDVSEQHLDELINLNVRSAFLLAQDAARAMVAQRRGGVIIQLSSQMGKVGAAGRTVYCMTKHAVEGMTKAMAIELAPHGIRVNTVAPTFIETEMTRPFLANEQFRSWVLSRLPLGRLGTEEEVANAIVFLSSPAASLMTGTSLVVDGGWTAQ